MILELFSLLKTLVFRGAQLTSFPEGSITEHNQSVLIVCSELIKVNKLTQFYYFATRFIVVW